MSHISQENCRGLRSFSQGLGEKYSLLLCTILWLTAYAAGISVLYRYQSTPGPETEAPGIWPERSQISRVEALPTLLLFAHPQCPCTRATLGELAILMAHCLGKVTAYVIFIQPKEKGGDWVHTQLWRNAQSIPGVLVRADAGRKETLRFHILTSGHALLYDKHGKLLFSGGITAGRGHEGDNQGLWDLRQLLDHEIPPGQKTPAFGCPLFEDNSPPWAKEQPCTRGP